MRQGNVHGARVRGWLIAAGGLLLFGLGVGVGRLVWFGQSGRVSSEPAHAGERAGAETRTVAGLARRAGGSEGAENSSGNPLEDNGSDKQGSASLGEALGITIGSLREAALLQEGFALAEVDIASALNRLESIEKQEDRNAFLRGVFARAAASQSLGEVFKMAAALEVSDREAALFSTLETLTEGRPETRQRAENFMKRFGLEAGVGMALSLDPVYRPEFADDWIAAFGNLDSRGVMIGSFASLRVVDDPEAAFAMGADLTGWDREMFFRALGGGWSQREPLDAWNWALEHARGSGPGGAAILGNVLRNLARKDFDAADEMFRQLTDPGQRKSAALALAQARVWDSGTAAAVEWANQLPSEAEKDVAHEAIGQYSPQGIGVSLGMKDGYAVINSLIPQGAAARNGQLQAGDRIVEVDPGTGQFQNIYGGDMSQTLNLIRGEAGSTVRLRVVREEQDGTLQDYVLQLTREQIVQGGS